MVVKDLTLVTDLHFNFAVKLYKHTPCAGDSGMIRVALTGSIRMGFGPDNKGICEYGNLKVKIIKVWNQLFPERIIKFSAKQLTHEKDLVPQIGRHATEQMCNEFRTLMNKSFDGEANVKAMVEKMQAEAAADDELTGQEIMVCIFGGIGVIVIMSA